MSREPRTSCWSRFSDPDPEVRRQAVFWLSQVGTERAVGALDSILRFSKDEEIQERAVFALSQHDSPHAQQALRTYAERKEVPESMRERAIFWLGQRQTPENAAFLRSLYGRLTGEELKKKVLFSLSQLGGEENGRWLLGIARDTSERLEMRKQALFWAGQGGVSIEELTRLYANVSDREMREQLVFVYSQRNEPAALDKLIEIAKKDPNPELRKRALFWLDSLTRLVRFRPFRTSSINLSERCWLVRWKYTNTSCSRISRSLTLAFEPGSTLQ